MVLQNKQLNWSQFDLNDPITKLMLMTNQQLTLTSDSSLTSDRLLDHEVLLPERIKMPRLNDFDIDTNQLPQEYGNASKPLDMNRRIVYVTVESMHKILKTPFDQKWQGQYLPDQNAVLLNYADQKYYYVQFGDNYVGDRHIQDDPYEKLRLPATIDAYQPEQINQVVAMILKQPESYQGVFRPDSNAFNALKNLWIAQTQTMDLKVVDHKIKINDIQQNAFTDILKSVLATRDQNRNRQTIKLTYQNLVDFYQEVQAHQLTSTTQKVQTWLFNNTQSTQSINDMLKILQYYPNFDQIQDQITEIQPQFDRDFKTILKQFQSDRYFPRAKDYQLKAYRIEQVNPKVKPHQKHFLGIHGTQGISVPTILCGGFKNHQQLKNDGNAQFVDTGQALGDGTYFAKLDQASKALNYGNHDTAYLIIADIAYHKPINVTSYDPGINRKHQYDFVIGTSVGIRNSYDEYVAVNPQTQVTLKYLLEISPNK